MSLDVTLPDDALDMRLDVWLDRHMESLRTLPLTRKTIDNRITIAKAVQALLGSVLLRDLKPFMILRMLAASMYEKQGKHVQRLLGHSSASMTAVYLNLRGATTSDWKEVE